MKVPTSVQRVPRAGHNLTIENPVDFAQMIIKACEGTVSGAKM